MLSGRFLRVTDDETTKNILLTVWMTSRQCVAREQITLMMKVKWKLFTTPCVNISPTIILVVQVFFFLTMWFVGNEGSCRTWNKWETIQTLIFLILPFFILLRFVEEFWGELGLYVMWLRLKETLNTTKWHSSAKFTDYLKGRKDKSVQGKESSLYDQIRRPDQCITALTAVRLILYDPRKPCIYIVIPKTWRNLAW